VTTLLAGLQSSPWPGRRLDFHRPAPRAGRLARHSAPLPTREERIQLSPEFAYFAADAKHTKHSRDDSDIEPNAGCDHREEEHTSTSYADLAHTPLFACGSEGARYTGQR
jgi:hypothetical protein